MSYTPTNWQTGDTITAGKLNSMESGIETSVPIIVTVTNNVASMTSTQIKEAIASGKVVILQVGNARYYEVVADIAGSPNSVTFYQNALLSANRLTIDKDGNCDSGALAAYSKPPSGIPEAHLAQGVKDKLNPFIVTLTPTEQDYSGTMDKTVGEINAAYEAGQEIWFFVAMPNGTYKVKCGEIGTGSLQYPSFNGIAHLNSLGAMIFVFTGITDDGTQQTYHTTIYPLTPMS